MAQGKNSSSRVSGDSTDTRGDTATQDATTVTTDADARTPTTESTSGPTDEPTPTAPLPGETSNTYVERVHLDNALTNAGTSPPRDV